MWTRRELKDRAKDTLRGNYWSAFLVALVLLIIGGVNLSGPFSFDTSNMGPNQSTQSKTDSGFVNFTAEDLPDMPNIHLGAFNKEIDLNDVKKIPFLPWFVGAIAVGFALVIIAAMAVWRIFLGYPMEVGCRQYFVKASTGEAEYKQMKFCFNSEIYWNVVKTMFMRSVYNFLWFLALIIPGIIKLYAYRMVPYILSEDPNMPYKEAIQRSEMMTNGHKLDMWILDLSFLGWYLLGLILCGVGGVFVNPYYEATKAELYLALKEAA